MLGQPLKRWGGKHCLAKRIIALMPRYLHYVEPWVIDIPDDSEA